MTDPVNPYASPQVDLTPVLGADSVEDVLPSLRPTEIGLTLVYYGIVVVLLSMLVLVFGGFVAADGERRILLLVIGVAGGGVLLGCLSIFVGHLLCLAVPGESGARGFIMASVACQLADIGMLVASAFVAVKLRPAGNLVFNLLGLAATVLSVLFMMRLAEYIARLEIVASAQNLLIALAAVVVVDGAVMVVMVSTTLEGPPARVPGPFASLLGLVLIVFGLIVFVMFANLVNRLRKALRIDRLRYVRQSRR